jgi:hypothetical protein
VERTTGRGALGLAKPGDKVLIVTPCSLIQDRLGKRAVHGIAVGAMCLSSAVALWAFLHDLLPAAAGERPVRGPTCETPQTGGVSTPTGCTNHATGDQDHKRVLSLGLELEE